MADKRYSDSFYAFTGARAERVAQVCAEILNPFTEIESLLDVGCGPSVFSVTFLQFVVLEL